MMNIPNWGNEEPLIPSGRSEGPLLKIAVRGQYWQLWARTITGIDLSHHCMWCLEGEQTPGLGPRAPRNQVLERHLPVVAGKPTIAWYICGVSTGNYLPNNAHMLAVPDPGNRAVLDWPWVKAIIYDARRIPIVPDFIDPHDRNANNPKFNTCRNWQAAWMIKKGALS